MKTGFIGLGRMGIGMVANLLKANHEVTVYNRTKSKVDELTGQGAKPATTVADTCKGEVVISMVSDDAALETVSFGSDGIVANLPRGGIHVSSSTISVSLSERLTAAHADAGQHFVAAPVFGRPDAAAAAKLFIVAAGASDAIKIAMPLFEAMGPKTFVVSDAPTGASLVKLSGNFLIASVIESLGEAMALVAKGGIDRQQYLEILTNSLFSAPIYKNYGGMIASGRFEPAGFAAPLGQKDIRLTLAVAEQLQVPLPLAGLLRDRFLALLAQGGAHLDWSAIGRLAARDAGLPD